jgi:hypothetical protein
MSRNYELLQQLSEHSESFSPSVANISPGLNQSAAAAAGVAPAREHLSSAAPASPYIRKIVESLFLKPAPAKLRKLGFCDIEHSGGAAAICDACGAMLASLVNGRVLLADAEPSRAPLQFASAPDRHAQITTAVPEGGITHDGTSHLWRLQMPINRGCRTGQLENLAPISAEFDYVCVNLPPVNSAESALTRTDDLDGIVLVIQAHSTRRDVVEKAYRSLESRGKKVVGAVLNNRRFPIPERIYKYL